MKQKFLQKFQGSLLLVMLVLACANVAYAGVASSDEISAAILVEGSIPVKWENDATYPWTIQDGWVKSGNVDTNNTSSSLAFSYSSEYQTEVTFNWWNNYSSYSSSYHWVRYYVDGAYKGLTTTSSQNQVRFYLPKGNHVVEIVDSIGNNRDSGYYAGLKNVRVKEAVGLENVLLTKKSLPISFVNDETYPWMPEDGYIQNTNYDNGNTTSKLAATVSLDKPSKLSFERRVRNNSYSHYFRFYINGELYDSTYDATNWGYVSVVLQPGEYNLEWIDSNTYNSDGNNYWSQIRNIELHNDWVEVDVTPGTLGVEVLYKVNVLKDVELLKVNGTINSSDWATIKQMTNIKAIDFSDAKIDVVPNSAFNGISFLSTVTLPEGLLSIGESAFIGTQIYYLTIPSTVKNIEKRAFQGTRLRNIDFAENSRLQTIGYEAFYQCASLQEFIMPNSVTRLDTYSSNSNDASTFSECKSLKNIYFSDALTYLPNHTCYNTQAVEEIHLPNKLVTIGDNFMYAANNLRSLNFPATLKSIGQNAFAGLHQVEVLVLPDSLTSIGEAAFHNSARIKTVVLPTGVSSYNQTFRGCSAIDTIVCRSATPPVITNDAFSSILKENVTLKVPTFAVASYKLDSYWYQFGNIIENNTPIDYWRITGDLRLLNNRRMEGKPDIDLTYGGRLTVSGNAPMTVGNFNIYVSEGNPSRLLNICSAFTADSIKTHFSVAANTWYFLTPMADVDIKDIKVSNTTSFVFRYYDGVNRASTGTGSSWKNVTESKLKAGQGYIFQCNAASVVTFPISTELHEQILSTEAISIPLTSHASDNAANKGWNYVGNPYPCYYDIFYMDFTAPITVWTGSTYRAYSIADDNYVLRPMQGFFVQKPDAVDAIVLQTGGKQIASTVNRASYAPARSRAANNRALFNLEISTDSICDMTRVVLNEDASLAYEIERDATKFMSLDADVAQIYTIDNEENRLSINERPEDEGIVKLGVYVSGAKKHTISTSHNDGDIYLFDAKENKIVDLVQEDYTFVSDETGNIDDRFTLRLKAPITSGINTFNDANDEVSVIGVNGGINVIAPANTAISVYGIDGNLYAQVKSGNNITKVELTPGMYIVNIAGKSYKAVVR